MRIATLIVRILLGLVFAIFGLNGFLHFLPNPPMPAAAGQFFGALFATGYMIPLLFATQVIGGILLLIGVFVPFALVILAPVVVNIFFFHLFLDPGEIPLAIVVVIFELFLAWRHSAAFAPLFRTAG
ncbi:MAG: DoxX family membrane protein [Candidatus Binataceae bacterium]